jgi:hypothetical protein
MGIFCHVLFLYRKFADYLFNFRPFVIHGIVIMISEHIFKY